MKSTPKLERVWSNHAREIVAPLVSVVYLGFARNVDPDGEVVERDVLDSFGGFIQRHNAESSRAFDETLRRQTRTHTAQRLSNQVGVSHVAEVELIHRVRAPRFGETQAVKLSAPI